MAVEALRRGDSGRFEVLLGELTGLTPRRLQRILYGPESDHLVVVSRAVGIDKLGFTSIYLTTRKRGSGVERADAAQLSRMIARYDEIDPGSARETLAAWRRMPDPRDDG